MRLACFSESPLRGIVFYCLSTLIVVAGVCLGGANLIGPTVQKNAIDRARFPDQSAFANFFGISYREIAETGYWYVPDSDSPIAFFPAYPLLGRYLMRATGMNGEMALLAVTHVSLAITFVLLAAYARRRYPDQPHELADWTMLAFGLLPTTLFFRMVMPEALLVVLCALTLYGIQRRWPPLVVALIVGVATATRPVGVSLVPVLALYAWRYLAERSAAGQAPTAPATPQKTFPERHAGLRRMAYAAAVTALGCWGLVAFMGYQRQAFGDPLAFFKSQVDWQMRYGDSGRLGDQATLTRKAVAELTLEPVWEVYSPSRPNYWQRHDHGVLPIFSMQFANPIYFLGTVALVILGWRKKWLNHYELLLSAGLLLMPYVLKSYDNGMVNFGRFSAVVLPVYLVLGQLLLRMHGPLRAAVLAISGFFLGVFSALFAAYYYVI